MPYSEGEEVWKGNRNEKEKICRNPNDFVYVVHVS